MTQPGRIVIVGSGLAGASCAATLRERDFGGEVLLFGNESHDPYELPALSKGILLGDTDTPDAVRDPGFYAEHDIDLRRGTEITGLRPADHLVVDSAGTEHPYDRLVLATGSAPRTLPVPGGDLTGLRTLRTVDDSLALRSVLTAGTRLVVVGAGWIGCEVAAAARKHDVDVTVVESFETPLRPVLGAEVGGIFRDLHTQNGVTWKLGTSVSGFDGDAETGAVRSVRLADGTELPADVVVVAVGVAPRVDLARAAGLDISSATHGVVVDAALRASAPDVYAIGDLASHNHPRYGREIRVEHWENAKDQGAHVAGNLLGADDPYQASPYFFSDQYDLGMEYRGLADADSDEVVIRGDRDTREFIAYWVRDGHVTAAMNVNIWDKGDELAELVDTGGTL